jgi:hypothetical protein
MAKVTCQEQRRVAVSLALGLDAAAGVVYQPAHNLQMSADTRVEQRGAVTATTLRAYAAARVRNKPLRGLQTALSARIV